MPIAAAGRQEKRTHEKIKAKGKEPNYYILLLCHILLVIYI